MENIVKKINEKYRKTKPYCFAIVPSKEDLSSDKFLMNLSRSMAFAYLEGDFDWLQEALKLTEDIPFDGNFDTWTWIESGWTIAMKAYLEQDNQPKLEQLKEKIINRLSYAGHSESVQRVNLKVFRRKLTGAHLEATKKKMLAQVEAGDKELEFGYSLVYLSDLAFVIVMNEEENRAQFEEEFLENKNRLLALIESYR